jgi:hypothetical protein
MIWLREQRTRNQDLQSWYELEIGPALMKILGSTLRFERMMIREGVSFPAGGSPLPIGPKPLMPL